MKRGSAGGKATAIILRAEALDRYYRNPNSCKKCGKIIKVKENEKPAETRRRKFCNKSCAAIYNNSRYPKRRKNFEVIDRKHKNKKKVRIKRRRDIIFLIKIYNECTDCFENKTKKDVFDSCKLWQTARNSIRKHARKVYLRSVKKLACGKCGYDLHIDVCHLKPVSEFPDHAFIREINHINNLVGLCPNHHWELDNNIFEWEF